MDWHEDYTDLNMAKAQMRRDVVREAAGAFAYFVARDSEELAEDAACRLLTRRGLHFWDTFRFATLRAEKIRARRRKSGLPRPAEDDVRMVERNVDLYRPGLATIHRAG